MNSILDLKTFREERLKIKTQENFARLLGVDPYTVSRWEKKPETLRLEDICNIILKTGVTFEELISQKKTLPDALQVKEAPENVTSTYKQLFELIAARIDATPSLTDYCDSEIRSLKKNIYSYLAKPLVAVSGRYSTGKSTLINQLLGIDKLPTGLSATSSIATYLMHRSDMPKFIASEQTEAWIFRDSIGNEESFDIKRIYDLDYCKKWKIAACGIESLQSYGSYSNENTQKAKAGAAVVFLDVDLLRNVSIVDLPGYESNTKEQDQKTFEIARRSDILIYMSDANHFMQESDISILRQHLALPLSLEDSSARKKETKNIFLLASRADLVDCQGEEKINEFSNEGKAKLKDIIDTLSLEGIDSTLLNDSFHLYSAFDPFLNHDFIDAFKKAVENVPISSYKEGRNKLSTYIVTLKQLLELKTQTLETKKELEELKQQIKQNEQDELTELCEEKIHAASCNVQSTFFDYFRSYITEINIVKKLDVAIGRIPAYFSRESSTKQKCIKACCNSMEHDIRKEFLTIIKQEKVNLKKGRLESLLQDVNFTSEKFFPILRYIERITPPEVNIKSRASSLPNNLGPIFLSEPEKYRIAQKIVQSYRQSQYINEYIQISKNYWEALYQYCLSSISELGEETTFEESSDSLRQELDTLANHLIPLCSDCLQLLKETETN